MSGMDKRKKIKERWSLSKQQSVFLSVLSSLIVGFFVFMPSTVEANENLDFSLYNRSSEVATSFGNQMAPKLGGDGSSSPWVDSLNAGNAGGLLGFSRDLHEDEEGIMGWLTSALSTSSATYSYEQLLNMGSSELYAYSQYGAALESLGLIDVRGGADSNIGRVIVGWMSVFVYWAATITPFLFNVVLQLLAVLNPFRFFGWIITGASEINVPIIGGIASLLTAVYESFQQISLLVVVPILIGTTAVSIFMFRGSAGKKLLRVFFRLFMIFAGLPLIGATYTGMIDQLNANVGGGSEFANYIMLSQFVDFEAWAQDSRLSPPEENPIEYTSGVGFGKHASRNQVFEINGTLTANNRYKSVYANLSSVDGNNFGALVTNSSGTTHSSTMDAIMGLLERYRKSELYTSSDYEGFVKSQLDNDMRGVKNGITSENIHAVFSPNAEDLEDGDYSSIFNPDHTFSGLTKTIYNSGSLSFDGTIDSASNFNTITFTQTAGSPSSANSSIPSMGNGSRTGDAGLSSLSMYNFLNTAFGQTSMEVYSPDKSASGFTRKSHSAVVLANKGLFSFVRVLESVVLVGGMAWMGLVYAGSLIQISMASIPRIMSGVFGTAVGSVAFITKLLIATIVLIVEIVGTIFLYQVSEALLLGIMKGLSDILSDTWAGDVYAFQLGVSVVTLALSGMVIYFSIKNRAKFAKMMEETVTNIIQKFMGGLDNQVNQGNAFHDPNAVAKGAQAGTVFGKDGKVGSDGSGSHAAKQAAGSDGGILDDLKGAYGDTQDQKLRDDRNPNTPEMTKGDVAKGTLSRLGKRQKARALDGVVGAFGGVGSLVGSQIFPTEDWSGNAFNRQIVEGEELDKQGTTMTGEYGLGDSNDENDVSSDSNNDTDDPNKPLSNDDFDKTFDGSDPDDDLTSLDEESTAVLESAGEVTADQETMGSVEEAIDQSKDSESYSDLDEKADEALEKVVSDAGGETSSVNLDDADSHPPVDPSSDDYDGYISSLGNAVDGQSASAVDHARKASSLEAEAKDLESKAQKLEAEGSPESLNEAKGLRQQASQKRSQAESEKKQGRNAMRKAQKLGAKQQSAINNRTQALKTKAGSNAKPVQAAADYASAQDKVKSLTNEQASLNKELDGIDISTPAGAKQAAETQSKLDSVTSDLGEAKQNAQKLQNKAVASLPDDGYVDLNSMSQEEEQAYQEKHNLSNAEMAQAKKHNPTPQEHRQAQVAAVRMLGATSKQGQSNMSPKALKQTQARYAQSEKNVQGLSDTKANLTKKLSGLDKSNPANRKAIAQTKSKLQTVDQRLNSAKAKSSELQASMTKANVSPSKRRQMQADYVSNNQGSVYEGKREQAMAELAAAGEQVQALEASGASKSEVTKANWGLTSAVNKVKSIDRQESAFNKLVNGSMDSQKKHFTEQAKSQTSSQKTMANEKTRKNVLTDSKLGNNVSKHLTPKIPDVSDHTIPDLSSSNAGVKARKMDALKNENVTSRMGYRSKMQKINQSVNGKEKQVKQLQSQIKRADSERRLGDAKKLRSRQLRVKQTLAVDKEKQAKDRSFLQDNAAALFVDKGFQPKANNLAVRPIKADMDQTTRALQEYAKIQARFEGMDRGVTPDSSIAEKTRHKQLKTQMVKLRGQLTSVGISGDRLTNSTLSKQAAKQLNDEWSNAKNGELYN